MKKRLWRKLVKLESGIENDVELALQASEKEEIYLTEIKIAYDHLQDAKVKIEEWEQVLHNIWRNVE